APEPNRRAPRAPPTWTAPALGARMRGGGDLGPGRGWSPERRPVGAASPAPSPPAPGSRQSPRTGGVEPGRPAHGAGRPRPGPLRRSREVADVVDRGHHGPAV